MSSVKVAQSAEQIFLRYSVRKKNCVALTGLSVGQRLSLSILAAPPHGEQRESNTKRKVIKAAPSPRRAGCWCWCLRLLSSFPGWVCSALCCIYPVAALGGG